MEGGLIDSNNNSLKIASPILIQLLSAAKLKSPRSEGAQKGKAGRPTLYRPEYCQQMADVCDTEPCTDKCTSSEHFGQFQLKAKVYFS